MVEKQKNPVKKHFNHPPSDWMTQSVIDENQAPQSGPTTPSGLQLIAFREKISSSALATTTTTNSKCVCPIILANRPSADTSLHSNSRATARLSSQVHNSHITKRKINTSSRHEMRRCQITIYARNKRDHQTARYILFQSLCMFKVVCFLSVVRSLCVPATVQTITILLTKYY